MSKKNSRILISLLIFAIALNIFQYRSGITKDNVIEKIYEGPFNSHLYRNDRRIAARLNELEVAEGTEEKIRIVTHLLNHSFSGEAFHVNAYAVIQPIQRASNRLPELGTTPYYRLQQEALAYLQTGEEINVEYYADFIDKKIQWNHYLFYILGMEKFIYPSEEFQMDEEIKPGNYGKRLIQKEIMNNIDYQFTQEELNFLVDRFKKLGLDEYFSGRR